MKGYVSSIKDFWRRNESPPEGNRTTIPRTSNRSPVTRLTTCLDCCVYVAKEISSEIVKWKWLLLPSFYSVYVQDRRTAVEVSVRTAAISDIASIYCKVLLRRVSTRVPTVVLMLTRYQRKNFYVNPFVLFYFTPVWCWGLNLQCRKNIWYAKPYNLHTQLVVTASCCPYVCVSERDVPLINKINSRFHVYARMLCTERQGKYPRRYPMV